MASVGLQIFSASVQASLCGAQLTKSTGLGEPILLRDVEIF